ncbi:MAG: hypothetical protein ACYDB3_05420, partial [Acidimicrobiales bacterium]
GTWSATEAPLPAQAQSTNGLYVVSCAVHGTCDALGDYSDSTGTSQVLIDQSVPAPTTLGAAPALAGLSGPSVEALSLHATLRSAGQPLAGQVVSFSAGSTVLCSAVTDASGTATCDVASQALSGSPSGVVAVGGADGYSASFAGSFAYLPSSASAPLLAT